MQQRPLTENESEKLKTVLELYDLETHEKKLGPDYHRLKTMVKRCIEQDLRNKKNYGARNVNYKKNAVVEIQGSEQRGQNSWRLSTMESQRAVFCRRQLYWLACKNDTAESVSKFFRAAE